MADVIAARLRLDGQRQFSAQAQQASKDVKGIGDSADKADAQMEKSTSKWPGRLKTAAKWAGTAALAAGASATVMGVKYNAALETSTVAFKGLLGSQGEAPKMMGRLQKFAAETPFEQQQLTSAAQRWVGVGNSAKSVIPSMRAVGDAVASVGGTPDDVMGVVTALTQMQNKGKASAEELQQIAERNIPAFKILSKQMGMSGAELSKKMSEGKVSADSAVKALLTGFGKQYKGAMEAQSKTFSGMVSTLKDNVNIILGVAMKPLFKWLTEKILPAVNNFLGVMVKAGQAKGLAGMLDALNKKAGGTGGAVGGIMKVIGKLVDYVRSINWGQLWTNLQKIGPIFQAAAATIGQSNFGATLGGVVKVAGPFTAVISAIITLLGKLLSLPGAPQIIGTLLALAAAAKIANKATGGLAGVMGKFVGQSFQMANTLATLVTQIIAYRTAKLLSTGATTAETGALNKQAVAQTRANATQQMGTLNLIRYRIATLASTVAGLAASAATKAWAAAQMVLNAVMSANPIALVVIAVVALIAAFVLAYTKVGWFRDGVNAALNAVKTAAMAVFGWIKANWPLLLGILTGPFGLAVVLIIKNFDKIKSAATTVFNAVKDIFGKIPGVIKSIFSGAGNFVAGLGRGLADWLNNNTPFGDRVEFSVLGKHIGFTIPALAAGGIVSQPGLAVVGDAGPELVALPAAATVMPLPAGGGMNANINVPVYLDTRQIALATGQWNSDQAARQGRAS